MFQATQVHSLSYETRVLNYLKARKQDLENLRNALFDVENEVNGEATQALNNLIGDANRATKNIVDQVSIVEKPEIYLNLHEKLP